MRRLFFLVPNVRTCNAIVAALEAIGITDANTSVVGNQFIPLEGLQKATFLQTSELREGLLAGFGIGGLAGLLGGVMVVAFPPPGLVLVEGNTAVAITLLATTLAGGIGGAVVSALVAKDIPNRKLEVFAKAISGGQLLLLVDVPRIQVEAVKKLIREHYPEARVGISRIHPKPSRGNTERVSRVVEDGNAESQG